VTIDSLRLSWEMRDEYQYDGFFGVHACIIMDLNKRLYGFGAEGIQKCMK